MEADWDEVSRAAIPVPGPHILPTVASTIAFDDEQELLWTGNEYVSPTTAPRGLVLMLMGYATFYRVG
jgi:hypothetical protein